MDTKKNSPPLPRNVMCTKYPVLQNIAAKKMVLPASFNFIIDYNDNCKKKIQIGADFRHDLAKNSTDTKLYEVLYNLCLKF